MFKRPNGKTFSYIFVLIFIWMNTTLLSAQIQELKIAPFSYKDFQYGIGLGYERFINQDTSASIYVLPSFRWYNFETRFEEGKYSGLELLVGLRKYGQSISDRKINTIAGVALGVQYLTYDYVGFGGVGNGGGVEVVPSLQLGFSIPVLKNFKLELIGDLGYKLKALERIPIDSPFGANARKTTQSYKGIVWGGLLILNIPLKL